MATLKQAKTPEEMRKIGVSETRKAYDQLATDYNRIINRDVLLCPSCGEWLKADSAFYMDHRYVTDRYPTCKRCLLKIVEQRNKPDDPPNETKQSVQKVLQMLDRVYDDRFYEDCVKGALDEAKEKNRNSPFATYITAVSSLPQYKGKTWEHSYFGEEIIDEETTRVSQKTIKNAKKRFGFGYSNDELMFLENEYQDWVTRHECNTKPQEELFEKLSLNKLERKIAVRDGKPTKDIDKTFQELLSTQNITPRQTSNDSLGNGAQTFGTLLQKWEETRPLPEIDPDLEDVDKIGLYIDAFFRGHTAKMFGIKNTFSHIYERVMKKYAVEKPQFDEDEDSEAVFEKVFGSSIDD